MTREFWQECEIENVAFLNAPKLLDERGFFRKVFPVVGNNLEPFHAGIAEVFYSNSTVGVIRGMHVQVGNASNYRYVFVVSGRIHDVIIDLRPKSRTYGKKFEFLFDDQSEVVLILPPGVAHGFQSLTPATIGYATSSHWQPNLDTGVNPLSIGIEWPIGHGLISERDNLLPNLFDWEKHLMQMEVGLES